MRIIPQWLRGSHIRRRVVELAALAAVATVLELAAAAGLSYVAGFSQVRVVLGHFHWVWLVAVLVGLIVSFAGYYPAYRGIFQVEGGPKLPRERMRAVVAAGFGGFLAHGGGALDEYALQGAGTSEEEAKVRVTGLAGMEHGVLAIGGCATAVTVLLAGLSHPSMDFTLPWAVIPIPGFLIGFWAAERYRGRFDGRRGWRRLAGVFLGAIHIIRQLFVQPRKWWMAVVGMALFWAADAFAAWSGMAAFGLRMNVAEFFVGFATGMVFTRRTGPLAGAGVLALVLPLTMWISGAPLVTAVVGMFTYRILALWLPMPVSLAALPTLRKMGQRREPEAEGTAEPPNEPGLEDRRSA